jgi:hypothetical protein
VREQVRSENLLQVRTSAAALRINKEVVARLQHVMPDELRCLADSSSRERGYLPSNAAPTTSAPLETDVVPRPGNELSAAVGAVPDEQAATAVPEQPPSVTREPVTPIVEAEEAPKSESTPAELLFSAVRQALQQLLSTPMKDAEVAAALEVSNAQAKAWLQRLVDEGVLEKQKKPAGYIVKHKRLFE